MDKQEIIAMLDRLIKHWRSGKEKAGNSEESLVASCYVDAYQTVRKNICGELLPNTVTES